MALSSLHDSTVDYWIDFYTKQTNSPVINVLESVAGVCENKPKINSVVTANVTSQPQCSETSGDDNKDTFLIDEFETGEDMNVVSPMQNVVQQAKALKKLMKGVNGNGNGNGKGKGKGKGQKNKKGVKKNPKKKIGKKKAWYGKRDIFNYTAH
jgi:hypothetical protein